MKEKLKNQKAITLIALVVTIVVLLILAGITINMVFSNNGVIKQAQEAKNVQQNAEEKDREAVSNLMEQANNIVNPVKIITFTIDGTKYQAEDGMTWEQWIDSDYSKSDVLNLFSINDDGTILYTKSSTLSDPRSSIVVYKNEKIEKNSIYSFGNDQLISYTDFIVELCNYNDTIIAYVPENEVTIIDLKDAEQLEQSKRDIFLESYEEATCMDEEDKEICFFYWLEIPERYITDDFAYAKIKFRCTGENIETSVNGNPMEVVHIGVEGSHYFAKLTEFGAVGIFQSND